MYSPFSRLWKTVVASLHDLLDWKKEKSESIIWLHQFLSDSQPITCTFRTTSKINHFSSRWSLQINVLTSSKEDWDPQNCALSKASPDLNIKIIFQENGRHRKV